MSVFSLSLDRSGASWAQERLRLGQVNVGMWVVVALGLLATQPQALQGLPDAVAWALVVALYTLVQAPFDLLGGYILPARHGRSGRDLAGWLIDWARGVSVHGGALLLFGWMALGVAGALGSWSAVGVLCVAGVGLVAAQGPLARLLATVRLRAPQQGERRALADAGLDPDRVQVADTADRSFVGGWVGRPGRERLWVPESWMSMGAHGREVVLQRRRHALVSGVRSQGVAAALLFNGLGLALTLGFVPAAGFGSTSGLLLVAAGTTLWSFLGLLTLPTASRAAVHQLDRWAAETVGDPARVGRVVQRLDVDQEDETRRSALVETIFHPVPSPSRRVDVLRMAPVPASNVVPWRVARMALFTSWANLSWLSRAVHCNSGRPELWALLPGD